MSAKKRIYTGGVVYYKQSTRQLIYDHDGHEDIVENAGWRNVPRLLYWACENDVEVVFASDEEEKQ